MRVKFSYLEDQFVDPKPILHEIEKLVRSADFTLGYPLREFESSFARLIGARYAVGVNSGTDALFLALKALGVGPGDEVITVSFTFVATCGAIVATGAKPVFVDIEKNDYVMSPALIEKAITPRTKALLPVHYAGHAANMPAIMAIARKHKLAVVEDSCQAITAAVDGQCTGTFGDAGGFSLHPLKNLNVWGDGGVIVTNSEALRDTLLLLRNHGLKNRDVVSVYGYNSRLDSLQACVGNVLIKDAAWITEQRIKWGNRLDAGLKDVSAHVTIPVRKPNQRYVYHLYMLMVKDRDRLLKYLIDHEIEAKVHYPIPMHLQECSRALGYKRGDLPVTEAQCDSIITLPAHQHLREEHIDYMIETIRKFYT
ncbi:MAG: DegT/DnrJ/EryC1/StrS family aminotransferase [Planctomycetota bacterium]|nr:DegT/DnrJ/EryC1/StrS family aminotransferase [Planctomycetota bacterium]